MSSFSQNPDLLPNSAETLRREPGFLGRAALVLAERDEQFVDPEYQLSAAERHDIGASMLREEAAQLARGPEARRLGEVFDVRAVPPATLRSLGFKGIPSAADLLRRLGAVDSGGAPAVSDNALFDFFRGHRDRMNQRQRTFEQHELPQMKQNYTARFKTGIRKGWLPKSAEANLSRLDNLRVKLDDGIDYPLRSHVRAQTRRLPAYAEMILGPTANQHTKRHELTHVVAGIDEGQVDEFGNIPSAHAGLKRLFPPKPNAGATALDEAVTDHIASVLYSGGVHVTKHFALQRKGVNMDPARLLDALSKYGVKRIDPKLFIEAYLENGSPGQRQKLGEKSALVRLDHALTKAFPGMDIKAEIMKVSSRDPDTIHDLADRLEARYRLRRRAMRLVPHRAHR